MAHTTKKPVGTQAFALVILLATLTMKHRLPMFQSNIFVQSEATDPASCRTAEGTYLLSNA